MLNIKGILGKKSPEAKSEREQEIMRFDKLSNGWNLENIQEYIRGHNTTEPLSDAGMASILMRFIKRRKDDHKFESGKRREFEATDRPERTKKGFDTVMSIASQSILTSDTIPLINAFTEAYMDVIKDLDTKLSQTYEHKMKDASRTAELNALAKSQFKRELGIKYE